MTVILSNSKLKSWFLVMALCLSPGVSQAQKQGLGPENKVAADAAVDTLARADALMALQNIYEALVLYRDLLEKYPNTTEARDARRAITIIEQMRHNTVTPVDTLPSMSDSAEIESDIHVYSKETGESLSIAVWEKLDFAGTLFSYGLGTGAALAAGLECGGGCISGLMAASAGAFGGAGLYSLFGATPDRGDLALIMGVSAYLPMTASFASLIIGGAAVENISLTAGVVGLGALPIGLALAHFTDLDPGDTQLIRDSIFWGALFGIAGVTANYEGITGNSIGWAGLIGGAFGGGVGAVMANVSDPTLERIRVITWAGYAGAAIGVLGGIAAQADRGYAIGAMGGAALGLTLGTIYSAALDDIPAVLKWVDATSEFRMGAPTVLAYRRRDGQMSTVPGVELLAGRW